MVSVIATDDKNMILNVLLCPSEYVHFKYKKETMTNNEYHYMVLGISEPTIPMCGEIHDIADKQSIIAMHTETGEHIELLRDGYCRYEHDPSKCKDVLVFYQALYGDNKLYVRPFDLFMSLRDKEKYPESDYDFRFTSVRSDITAPLDAIYDLSGKYINNNYNLANLTRIFIHDNAMTSIMISDDMIRKELAQYINDRYGTL